MTEISLFLSQLDSIVDGFFFDVIRFVWQSSILITAAWIICLILSNESARLKSAIWTVTLLMLPFLPLLSSAIVTNHTWDINIEIESAVITPSDRTDEPFITEPVASQKNVTETLPESPLKYKIAIVFLVYCIGLFIMFSRFALNIFRVYRWKINGKKVIDLHVINHFENLKNRIGISRAIDTFQSNNIPVPMVLGIFSPSILLPATLLEHFDDNTIGVVLAHEYIHIARKDNLTYYYASLLQIFLFFHPLVWFATHQLAHKIEEAVDNAVMEKNEIKASSYASILFGMAAAKLAPTTILPFSRNHKLLTRINNILKSTNTNQEGLKMSNLNKYSLVSVVSIALIFSLFININFGSKNIISGIGEAQNQELIYMTITGKVIDPEGNPVAGIPVDVAREIPLTSSFGNSLTGDTRFTVRTDINGDFRITFPTNIERGNRNTHFTQLVRRNSGKNGGIVLVAHAGNNPTLVQDHRWISNLANGISHPINLEKGDVGPVTIKLTKGATISGTVNDSRGKLLPNQRVRVAYADGRYNRYYIPFTKTDDTGHFTISNVRPGKIWVIATEGYMIFDGKSPFPDNTLVTLEVSENSTIEEITMVGLTIDELKATITPEIMRSSESKMKYNVW
ncbi:M56 family metallopeptidase [Candidatus Latescibacterota bacterium]